MKIINAIKDFFAWLWNPTSALVQEMQRELEKMGYILPNARLISVEQALEVATEQSPYKFVVEGGRVESVPFRARLCFQGRRTHFQVTL